MGFIEVSCDVQLNSDDRGMVAVRLCDVFPSGEARLVATGVRNLCRDQGGNSTSPIEKGSR